MGVQEPHKHVKCARCGIEVNPVHGRYLWVGFGERGACVFGEQGNVLFRRKREQGQDIFCGPCGDQWREREERFRLGEGLRSFAESFEMRGFVRD